MLILLPVLMEIIVQALEHRRASDGRACDNATINEHMSIKNFI